MTSTDNTPIPDGYKRCSKGDKCLTPGGPMLPSTEAYFHRKYKGQSILHSACRKCQNAASKVYSQTPERKEKERERQKTPERIVYSQIRHQSPKYKSYEQSYRRTSKGRVVNCAKSHRRRARERLLPADFTYAEWEYALRYFNDCCAYCGRPRGFWHTLAQDHYVPVCRGGGYTSGNILPACHGVGGCNNSKNNREAQQWLVARFGVRKAKRIEVRIAAYFNKVVKQQKEIE